MSTEYAIVTKYEHGVQGDLDHAVILRVPGTELWNLCCTYNHSLFVYNREADVWHGILSMDQRKHAMELHLAMQYIVHTKTKAEMETTKRAAPAIPPTPEATPSTTEVPNPVVSIPPHVKQGGSFADWQLSGNCSACGKFGPLRATEMARSHNLGRGAVCKDGCDTDRTCFKADGSDIPTDSEPKVFNVQPPPIVDSMKRSDGPELSIDVVTKTVMETIPEILHVLPGAVPLLETTLKNRLRAVVPEGLFGRGLAWTAICDIVDILMDTIEKEDFKLPDTMEGSQALRDEVAEKMLSHFKDHTQRGGQSLKAVPNSAIQDALLDLDDLRVIIYKSGQGAFHPFDNRYGIGGKYGVDHAMKQIDKVRDRLIDAKAPKESDLDRAKRFTTDLDFYTQKFPEAHPGTTLYMRELRRFAEDSAASTMWDFTTVDLAKLIVSMGYAKDWEITGQATSIPDWDELLTNGRSAWDISLMLVRLNDHIKVKTNKTLSKEEAKNIGAYMSIGAGNHIYFKLCSGKTEGKFWCLKVKP